MKLEKISYRRLFPTGAYANESIELSGTLEPNEDTLNAYTQLHKMAEELHYSKNAEMYAQQGTQVRDIVEDKLMTNELKKEQQIKGFVEAINTCTSLKTLNIFKTLVERENLPELTEAFDNKLNTFQ